MNPEKTNDKREPDGCADYSVATGSAPSTFDTVKTHIAYPGYVTSSRDGNTHYIGFRRLCELHQVEPAACMDGSRESEWRGRDVSHLTVIRPRMDGQYPCFTPNGEDQGRPAPDGSSNTCDNSAGRSL